MYDYLYIGRQKDIVIVSDSYYIGKMKEIYWFLEGENIEE